MSSLQRNGIVTTPPHRLERFQNTLKHAAKTPQTKQSSVLEIFWQEVHDETVDLKGTEYDSSQEVRLYNETACTRIQGIIQDLIRACLMTRPLAVFPRLAHLEMMPVVCVILSDMGGEGWLEHFITEGITDDELPLSLNRFREIFRPEHVRSSCLSLHALFDALSHPLQALKTKNLRQTAFGDFYDEAVIYQNSVSTVLCVRQPSTGSLYALKESRFDSKETDDSIPEHNEWVGATELSHRHIAQALASSAMDGKISWLISPVAGWNLFELLHLYRRSRESVEVNTQHLSWLHSTLLTALGCLSKGLDHLHRNNAHYGRIASHFILLEHVPESHNGQPRIFWADLASTIDIRRTNFQGTHGKPLTSRYASPENGSLVSGSSRSDIYALGCIFLEVVGCLNGIVHPSFSTPGNHHEQCQQWQNMVSNLPGPGQDPLGFRKVGELALQMTSELPESRPSTKDVIDKLAKLGSFYFCAECAAELTDGEPSVFQTFDLADIQQNLMDSQVGMAQNVIQDMISTHQEEEQIPIDDDDQDIASLFSVDSTTNFSAASSITSVGSVDLKDPAEELAQLLLNDALLAKLLNITLQRKNAQARFVPKFRTLLTVFGKDYQREALAGEITVYFSPSSHLLQIYQVLLSVGSAVLHALYHSRAFALSAKHWRKKGTEWRFSSI